ncbi:putative bifunctional diguanylate cyclase/phosphodiesterase [Aliikangiella coralliicola]|uniref:EAL domain-containing protein n=1 Tax=Aliikangiella coralliicola TaxID=2592383 RepID=A0A545U0A0_9GAMM|nr:EAL domain-containing protein [Aliikangiella coralliicola]TQV82890.1 EAL domain-containing protein [Aliikangiella coralliicola]
MKRKRPPLSFRAQLTLMMTIIVIVMTIAFVLFLYLTVNKTLEQNTIDKAVQHAHITGEKAKAAVKSIDDAAANQVVKQLGSSQSVHVAALLLANGSLLGYYTDQQGMPLPEMDISQRLERTETELFIAEPIFDDEQLVGYVYVNHNLQQLLSQENLFIFFIAGLFVASIIVSIILAGYFQNLLTLPIRRMVRHVNNVYKSKNFEKRLNPRSDDEIGRLIKGFNKMLDAVQERENELTMHGKQLQRLVEVRTEQLYQKAHFDSLTGLPNRYLLVDRLHQAISKSSRTQSILALLFLDLDRFKVINDNLGHQNGDQLLKEVAKRLSKMAREGDTVARLGGDEFVFLLENLNSPRDAAITARRIIDSFKTPFRLQEHILHVSTSIGISIYPNDGSDDKILLKNADISMYHAKEKGPGNYSFYSDDMNQTSLERLAIESNLRNAIENNEFHLVYQPQMRLKDNQYKNVEALIRWNNSDVGEISPAVFIPIAEETGIINQIDLWVISQVCKQLRLWREQGMNDITVAINVSAGHLISDTLLEHLKKEILLNQIVARQLEIEITEAVFVEHTQRTIENLTAIKKIGARIAIDDFGTGYSSLQYIQNFPADTLKLDGMFIKNLKESKASQGIVRSTIILAHSLGLELVTECVEDQYQLDFLTKHQCDLVQGFLLSKPVSPEEILVICK